MKSEAQKVPPVQPGDILDGKYRVERLLGAGAMGAVVAARHLELGQLVAIKVLLVSANAEMLGAERFLREARASVRLRSEHVARVFDVGKLDLPRAPETRGMPYIVMEYLEGEDLAVLSKRGPVPIPEAVTYVYQACDALQEAHQLGIVHRDIKPANMFITRRANGSPFLKVLDFGISKVPSTDGTDERLTSTNAILGTPLYMAPEQMRSTRNAEPRSDIWALGAVLYRLLTGIPPFQGENVTEICSRVLMEEPEPLGTLRADVPPALAAIVNRCLEKEVEARFASAAELAAALLPFTLFGHLAGGMGTLPPTSAPASQTPYPVGAVGVVGAIDASDANPETLSAASASRHNIDERERAPRGRSGLTAFIIAGITSLVVIGVGLFGWSYARSTEHAPAAAPAALSPNELQAVGSGATVTMAPASKAAAEAPLIAPVKSSSAPADTAAPSAPASAELSAPGSKPATPAVTTGRKPARAPGKTGLDAPAARPTSTSKRAPDDDDGIERMRN